MKLGIVGHEAAKFTEVTHRRALEAIADAILEYGPTHIVSGGCHLGGIDIWAEEAAEQLSLPTIIHKPMVLRWGGQGGFQERNLAIARDSDLVLCIVVEHLPEGYTGMRFSGCYHCDHRRDSPPTHVKSGGCWTAWRARQRAWTVIREESHASEGIKWPPGR